MAELQRIAANSDLVFERFKWKIISYFYGNHHWICSSLSKKSDIAELRVVEIVVQIRSIGNDLKIWLKLNTAESHYMKRLVTPWRLGQNLSVLESVFIPSDDQIPAWEEQTTILPMCIGPGPWDPRRPPCRHEPGEQIKKSPWLSSRIQTWSGASFKMTSASASSSFTSSGCWSARFTDSVGSWALDKMSISSV